MRLSINTLTIALFLTVFFSALVLLTGLSSDLCLGDEVYYYRFAKLLYQTDRHPLVDTLYESSDPLAIPLNSEILWPFVLSKLWQFSGGVSSVTAQLYQTAFYLVLLFMTYLLAKDIYGEKEGLSSIVVLATAPMIATFGILLYLDVPATALVLLCIFLHRNKRYCFAGAVLGITYLTKRLPLFFIPGFLVLILLGSENIKQKVRNIAYFLIPAIIIMLPDLYWRGKAFNRVTTLSVGSAGYATTPQKTLDWAVRAPGLKDIVHQATKSEDEISTYYNSFLLNPLCVVRYIGIMLPLLVILYFVLRKNQRKDLYLWILIGSYAAGYLWIFGVSDTRYTLPAVPLIAILVSKVFLSLNKKVKVLFFMLLFFQFGATLFYVQERRHISSGIQDGFNYVRENVPESALVMYPEYTLLEYADRRMAWNRLSNFQRILWPYDETELQHNIFLNRLGWIAIKKSRVYDDSKVRHYGGYPKSFVKRLHQSNFLEVVFENDEMVICKVM